MPKQGPGLLARADSAGATYEFAAACRQRGVGFSFGFPVTEEVRLAISLVPEDIWEPAIEADGEERDGAYLAELTRMLDLSAWPGGPRVVVRRENPHPGAALTLFEAQDGWRYTAFITGTGRAVVPGGIAGLELRHRRHARVEDRIRQSKAAGLNNFPCWGAAENKAWMEAATGRRRPRVLVQAHLLCRRARHRPLRDRGLPLRHIAHGRPHHTLCPIGPPALGQGLGMGEGAGTSIFTFTGRF